MKLLFINPNYRDAISSDAMQPLIFAILKKLTPTDVDIVFFDERIEHVDFSIDVDAVVLSIQTFTAKRAYAIASQFKQRDIPVIGGGFHVALLPDEAEEYLDSIVIGDAEPVWSDIIADLKDHRLKKRYQAEEFAALRDLIPDRSIFRGKKYAPFYPVQFGRGCRFSCDFCSIHAFYHSTLRQRPVAEVVEEIRSLDGNLIFFVDDNLFSNFDSTSELLQSLIPLKIRWVCQVSIDAAYEENLLLLMQEAGCILVFVGFESFDEGNLRTMKKSGNLKHHTDYYDAVRRFKKYGIMVSGSFVFGYDHDDEASVDAALSFAMKAKLCFAHFNILFPAPKTPLLERLKAEDRLLHLNWWIDDSYRYGDCYFHPKGISTKDLEEKIFATRRKFNSWPAIIARFLDFQSNARNFGNALAYFSSNLISRGEIKSKQGMKLG